MPPHWIGSKGANDLHYNKLPSLNLIGLKEASEIKSQKLTDNAHRMKTVLLLLLLLHLSHSEPDPDTHVHDRRRTKAEASPFSAHKSHSPLKPGKQLMPPFLDVSHYCQPARKIEVLVHPKGALFTIYCQPWTQNIKYKL